MSQGKQDLQKGAFEQERIPCWQEKMEKNVCFEITFLSAAGKFDPERCLYLFGTLSLQLCAKAVTLNHSSEEQSKSAFFIILIKEAACLSTLQPNG